MKLQTYSGGPHEVEAKPLPGETLIVHEPDPNVSRILKTNDISETRYGRVLAVGEAVRGRNRDHEEGQVVLLETAVCGIHVPGLYFQNRKVHRVLWRNVLAVVEMDNPNGVEEVGHE